VTTYLCALVAELAYHHVPQFEIDDAPKRAKLVVPSYGYRRPVQVKRDGDIVPAIPPKRLGYADHPREYDIQGNQHPTLGNPLGRFFLWRAALFLGKGFEPHKMERYREELVVMCGARFADQPLSDYEKLTSANLYTGTSGVQP
jgi:hypothetical protein